MSGLAISDRNSHYARSPRAFLVPHPERCHGILSASLRRPNDVVGPPEVQRRTALCEGSRSCLSEARSGEKKAVSACVTIKQRDMSDEWGSGADVYVSRPEARKRHDKNCDIVVLYRGLFYMTFVFLYRFFYYHISICVC